MVGNHSRRILALEALATLPSDVEAAVTKKRRKQEEENRRRMEAHSREHQVAVVKARAQHKPVDGFREVHLDSIADQLDQVDPRIPALHRAYGSEPEVSTEPIAAPYRDHKLNGEAFIPPKFQPSLVRETKEMMSSKEALFSSNERVVPKSRGVPGGRGSKGKGMVRYGMSLKLPGDVVEAMGAELLEGIHFEVEVLEEGILFRPAGTRPAPQLPAWAKRHLPK
jgi:hypothetical protein